MTSLPAAKGDALITRVQAVLDAALSLGEKAYALKPESPLLGALPELDSQAVLGVLMGIEEAFGIAIDDDEIDAEVFATLGSLAELVERKLSGR